jgi:hypothetical protein
MNDAPTQYNGKPILPGTWLAKAAGAVHERGESARANKRELDPDSSLTRGDWWALALMPSPLIWIYTTAVRRKKRKAGL